MKDQVVGYVRWKEIIPILIAIFSMAVSISIGAMFIHGQSPHKDAVPRPEFNRFTKSVDNQFNRVLDKLDRIEENIK